MPKAESIHKNYKPVTFTMPGPDGQKVVVQVKACCKDIAIPVSRFNHNAWRKDSKMEVQETSNIAAFNKKFGDSSAWGE